MFLWDAGGKRSVKVRVANEDLSAVKARVQKILEEANITGVSLEENLDHRQGGGFRGHFQRGQDPDGRDILQPYSDNMMNLVKEEKNEDLIQVDMEIVEISTSLEKDLGIALGKLFIRLIWHRLQG